LNYLGDVAYLPVRFSDGTLGLISPWEASRTRDGRTPLAPAFADNLLNRAAVEMVAGFLQVLAAPETEAEWRKKYLGGMQPDSLRAAFEPFRPYFEVFGPKPAFQDSTVQGKVGKEWGVEKIFHGSPGDQTRDRNQDFFGGEVTAVGLGTAMIQLAAFQSHAHAGGPGFRVSISGGGPLRAVPDVGDTLFQAAWALVLPRAEFESLGNGARDEKSLFPWLAPSTRRRTAGDSPASHLYFATPRRLLLSAPVDEGRCPLSGIDGPLVRTVREAQSGPDYSEGGWEHPLTPWRKAKDGKKGIVRSAMLAVRYPSGVSWHDRVGLTVERTDKDGTGVEPSRIVTKWLQVRGDLLLDRHLRIACYGVRCNRGKVVGSLLGSQPVRVVAEGALPEFEAAVRGATGAADLIAWLLKIAVQDAWFPKSEQEALRKAKKSEVMAEKTAPLVARFWAYTQGVADAYCEEVAAALENGAPEAIDDASERLLTALGTARSPGVRRGVQGRLGNGTRQDRRGTPECAVRRLALGRPATRGAGGKREGLGMSDSNNSNKSGIDVGGFLTWHIRLTGKAPTGADGEPTGDDQDGQNGPWAELRRARTPSDVMLCPAFASLVVAAFPERDSIGRYDMEALARTAYVAAGVKRLRLGASIPLLMAKPQSENSQDPVVSPIRANALFRTRDEDEAARLIRRLLPQIGEQADLLRIYWAMRRWDDTRRQWATAYNVAVHRRKATAEAA
jgi:CRISPR system Cascade subunit CasA